MDDALGVDGRRRITRAVGGIGETQPLIERREGVRERRAADGNEIPARSVYPVTPIPAGRRPGLGDSRKPTVLSSV